MQYNPKTRVLQMSLVDLEHCGFDYGEFDFELRTHVIDPMIWPVALVVDFSGGAVYEFSVSGNISAHLCRPFYSNVFSDESLEKCLGSLLVCCKVVINKKDMGLS